LISASDITVVIPTYGREQVLVDAITYLLALHVTPGQILVIDQTLEHEPRTWQMLNAWIGQGVVQRITFSPPSIPHAMNQGLLHASTAYVLYLDDDIIPDKNLITAFVAALNEVSDSVSCLVGQIIQPDQNVISFDSWRHSWFPFNSDRRQSINDVMAGNLCVRRATAIRVGGFDENFKGSAHNFESEFARRMLQNGEKILFEPSASIRHLRAERGGTRAKGHHLTTWRPHHAVGKYYYAFRRGLGSALRAVITQPFRAVRTRYHLRHPWWIPVSLLAEFLAIGWALLLLLKGPHLLQVDSSDD